MNSLAGTPAAKTGPKGVAPRAATVTPAAPRPVAHVRATAKPALPVMPQILGASVSPTAVGPGLFEGSTTLPPLPQFAHGSYAVTFVARDANGLTTQSAVGVTVR